MKNKLENIIRENKEFFNDKEPLEGHFKRFESKLNKESGKSRKPVFRIVWQAAAAVIFAFLLVNQALIYFGKENHSNIRLASYHPEYSEMEVYYTNAINTGINHINTMPKDEQMTEDVQQLMDEEMLEFEQTFKKLQEELNANPDDQRVINAMIEFYQTKLNVITMILENMKKVKQVKNTDYETEI